MTSMREIKRRKESIQSTEQITKAMKLVSTAKLQKAKVKAEQSRPYYEMMYDTVSSILRKSGGTGLLSSDGSGPQKKAVIVMTSNRGLAGGYNHNLVKLIAGSEEFRPDVTRIYAIGRKGRDFLAAKGYEIAGDYSDLIGEPSYRGAASMVSELMKEYKEGAVTEIDLAYTSFQNTVTQTPELYYLFPGKDHGRGPVPPDEEAVPVLMNYEPDEETVLELMLPGYLSSVIYGALLEAAASEHGARMTAMDSATSNAQDMIEELGLQYNRARQGAITQELTEIIAGASSIS